MMVSQSTYNLNIFFEHPIRTQHSVRACVATVRACVAIMASIMKKSNKTLFGYTNLGVKQRCF